MSLAGLLMLPLGHIRAKATDVLGLVFGIVRGGEITFLRLIDTSVLGEFWRSTAGHALEVGRLFVVSIFCRI